MSKRAITIVVVSGTMVVARDKPPVALTWIRSSAPKRGEGKHAKQTPPFATGMTKRRSSENYLTTLASGLEAAA
jgi:hypothetical protein